MSPLKEPESLWEIAEETSEALFCNENPESSLPRTEALWCWLGPNLIFISYYGRTNLVKISHLEH